MAYFHRSVLKHWERAAVQLSYLSRKRERGKIAESKEKGKRRSGIKTRPYGNTTEVEAEAEANAVYVKTREAEIKVEARAAYVSGNQGGGSG